MVIQPLIGLALALPTGLLFGLGYGTGVRIGYEQIYPLLFPKGARLTTSEVTQAITEINVIYNAIGGKEASQMGIGMGIASAGELMEHPNFQVLEALESRLSGRTPGSSDRHQSDDDFLEESDSNVMYTFEWIQDFIRRIALANRSTLLSWRAFLESDNAEFKLSPGDISTLLNLVNQALLQESQTEGDDTVTQAYRDAFQRVLDSLPLNELQQMYNVRGQYPDWQRQMIVKTWRARNIHQEEQTDYEQRRQVYTNEVIRLQRSINSFNQWIDKALNQNQIASAQRELKKQQTAEKKLINFITISRNDLTLKSLANNDWNNRIWKIHRHAPF